MIEQEADEVIYAVKLVEIAVMKDDCGRCARQRDDIIDRDHVLIRSGPLPRRMEFSEPTGLLSDQQSRQPPDRRQDAAVLAAVKML